jgi:hypothetical protein
LVLGLVDLVFLVSALVAAAGGSTKWLFALMVIAVMGANLAVCLMLGLQTLRMGPSGDLSSEGTHDEGGDDQGTDAEAED